MSYTKKPRTINFDRYEMIPSPFETIRSSKLPDKKHEEIIASKLYIKDLKHRQLSQFEEVIKIEAPFVMGNRMSIRLKAPITPRSYTAIIKSKRPKTVNTVFRSKTCQPSSRRRYQSGKLHTQTVKQEEHETLKPCWK